MPLPFKIYSKYSYVLNPGHDSINEDANNNNKRYLLYNLAMNKKEGNQNRDKGGYSHGKTGFD